MPASCDVGAVPYACNAAHRSGPAHATPASTPLSSQVLLRWNVQRGVGVIPKAGSAGHVRENADIFSFSLTYAQKVRGGAAGERRVIPRGHVCMVGSQCSLWMRLWGLARQPA